MAAWPRWVMLDPGPMVCLIARRRAVLLAEVRVMKWIFWIGGFGGLIVWYDERSGSPGFCGC